MLFYTKNDFQINLKTIISIKIKIAPEIKRYTSEYPTHQRTNIAYTERRVIPKTKN